MMILQVFPDGLDDFFSPLDISIALRTPLQIQSKEIKFNDDNRCCIRTQLTQFQATKTTVETQSQVKQAPCHIWCLFHTAQLGDNSGESHGSKILEWGIKKLGRS